MKYPGVQQEEIRIRLKWLMVLRVGIVTLLLGTSLVFQIGYGKIPTVPIFSLLIAGTYFLTIVYSLLINRIRWLTGFAYLQLSLDLGLETALVYYTGGLDSPFSPFYMITILAASIILDRRGGVLTATLAGTVYGLVVGLQHFRLTPGLPALPYTYGETLYLFFLSLVAYVTVAYLTGSLAERLQTTRKDLVEKAAGLADLKTFHENVIQSVNSGLLTVDQAGRITSFNRAGQEIMGYSQEEVRGRLWWEVFEAHKYKTLGLPDNPLRYPVRLEHECRKKGGTQLILGMTASPLKDRNGQVTGGVLAFQDLTRIREMEEEIKRKKWLATIGEMAAGMAHEIRNPLASLSGAMQVLKRQRRMDEEGRHLMDIALKETDRLNSIITSFLLYARPAPLNRKRCDLREMLTETLDLLQKSKDYHPQVQVETRYAPERLWVDVDLDQMKQVFWNLALNAVQAMPHGGRLAVTTQRLNRFESGPMAPMNHRWVRITFMDTGHGIPAGDLDKIFYPFFTTKDKGSGLGLSIVHRIIEDHHGRIHVDSQVGVGTTFHVFLSAEETEGESGSR
jgi:two-component system sensor histidine kinase PilS (NtrC family)